MSVLSPTGIARKDYEVALQRKRSDVTREKKFVPKWNWRPISLGEQYAKELW
jgi:hypothetical protein